MTTTGWQQYLVDPNAEETMRRATFESQANESVLNQQSHIDQLMRSVNYIGGSMQPTRPVYQGGPTRQNSLADIYEARLKQLQYDPSAITSSPGYQAGFEAVQRSMASQGYMGSGNMATELQKYGGDFYLKELQALGGLRAQERAGTAQQGQVDIGGAQVGLQGMQIQQQGRQWDLNRSDELAAGDEYRRMMEQFSRPIEYEQPAATNYYSGNFPQMSGGYTPQMSGGYTPASGGSWDFSSPDYQTTEF